MSPTRLLQLWSRIWHQSGERRSVRQVAGIGARAIRLYGWQGALDRLRHYGSTIDPAADYSSWCERHTPDAGALAAMAAEVDRFKYRPLISVITPVWNTDPRWLTACVESVRNQVYPFWELCLADDRSESQATRDILSGLANDSRIKVTWLPENSHISAASNAALRSA